MVDIEKIILRIKEFKRITKKQDLAVILGILPSDLANRVKRGTLLPLIIDWGLHENVSLDWLINGEKSTKVDQPLDADPEINDLLKKTRDVLVSDTSYAESLKANVNSFHESVKAREHMQTMQSQINELKQYIMTDRRRGDRRIDTTPGSGNDLVDKLKSAHNRRSGPDRRKSGLGK